MELSAVAVSVAGNVRRVNQGNLYIGKIFRPLNEQDYSFEYESKDEFQVYSVCGGMGGEEAGEEAFLLAVNTMADCSADYVAYHRRKDYILQANERV